MVYNFIIYTKEISTDLFDNLILTEKIPVYISDFNGWRQVIEHI